MIYSAGSTVKPWLECINQQFIFLLQLRLLNNTSRYSPHLIPCFYWYSYVFESTLENSDFQEY